VGRVLVISASLHAVFLVLLPIIPRLGGDMLIASDVYAVELLDVPAGGPAGPAVVAPAEPEPAPEQPKVETPAPDGIPEEPRKAPARSVPKPPPRPEKSLEERIDERMRAEDARRGAEPAPARETQQEAGRPAGSSGSASGAGPGRTSISVSRFPYAWYVSIIQGKISSNWKQPSDRLVSKDALTSRVSFRISRNGSVDAITVRRSSGSTTVDQSATKAVRAAAPFPPLPDDYRENSLDVTIDFTVERK
jgi:protein TonB